MEYSPTSGVEIDYEVKDNKVFFKGILRQIQPNHPTWKHPSESIEHYNEMVFQFQSKIYCEITFGDYFSSDFQENFKNAFFIKDIYTKVEDNTFFIIGELTTTTEAGGIQLLKDAQKGTKFFSRIVWECGEDPSEVSWLKSILQIHLVSPSSTEKEWNE